MFSSFSSNFFQKSIGFLLLLVAILGVGYIGYRDFYKKETGPDTKTTTTGGVGVTTGSNDQATVTQLPVTSGIPTPSLNRAITFAANSSFSEEAKALMRTKLEENIAALKKDPTHFEPWLTLGLNRKIIGDYEGAKEVWEYLNKANPGNFISFLNLGDLYHYYLKDFPKSEANFLQAIKNGPSETGAYIGLHELYKLSYKQETTKAADILKEALVKRPADIDVMVTLATYYKEKGNKAEARVYFEKALTAAKSKDNQALVARLEEELASL